MSKSMKKAFEKVSILQQANQVSLDILAACGTIRKMKKGEILFLDRDVMTHIYIVISGSVSLYKINSQGERKVIFVLGDGQLINEVILQDIKASINCEIFEDADILSFTKKDLLHVMEHDFSFTKAVLDSLSLKIRRLYRQLKNTSGGIRGDKRVAAKLWKLSGDFGVIGKDGLYVNLNINITYLADMLGMKRETVSRHLKELSKKELVIIKENHFMIPCREALANYFKSP